MAKAAQAGKTARGDPNIVALLSLKLLLLAFFILLNALSKFEDEKTRRVLESVNDAFNGQIRAVRNVSSYSGAIGSLQDSRTLVVELLRLFRASIPAADVTKAERGERFLIEFPADALFRQRRVELRTDSQGVLKRLADTLRQRQEIGLDFAVTIFNGVASTRDRRLSSGGTRLLEIRRGNRLIEELQARGIEAGRLSMGLLPGAAGRIRIEIARGATAPVLTGADG